MQQEAFVIVAGVGPGTGASVAHRFAPHYPIVLLSRNPANTEGIAAEINSKGGKAYGITADVTSQTSLATAFDQLEKQLPGMRCAAAVFNAAGGFVRKPLLDVSLDEFRSGFDVNVQGAFLFSQRALPLMLRDIKSAVYPPTLIFTGATASIKANPNMATFASAKFANRALAASIAKEYAPHGVHVALAIIDGPIDIPGSTDFRSKLPAEAKISPDAIAEAYWNLHTQDKRALTHEIDIRTSLEKW